MSSISERNPCPRCGHRPALMAGPVLDLGNEYILVCWQDSLAKIVGPTHQWGALTKRKKVTEWTKFSANHWQRKINGQFLDYWPTRKKWRYANKTQVGDVDEFIRSLKP